MDKIDINLFKDKNNKLSSIKLGNKYLLFNHPNIFKSLNEFILINELKIARNIQSIWHFNNGIIDIPKCKHCLINDVYFVNYAQGYNIFCSRKCAQNDPEHLKKQINHINNIWSNQDYRNKQSISRKKAWNDNSENIISKRKKTLMAKYGVENIYQRADVKKKIKKIKAERYGDENYTNKKKIFKTKLTKYNDGYYNNLEKIKETLMEKFGIDNPLKIEEFKRKKKITCIKKYGVDNPTKNLDIQEKIRNTCVKKYGVDNPMKNEEIFLKQQLSGFILKKFKNTKLYYRGKNELTFLLKCEELNILNNITNGPTIKYMLNGKSLIYFSDFFYSPLNLILEIKSNYTYNLYLEKNLKKEEACLNLNYNFLFIIDNNFDIFFNKIGGENVIR